MIDCDGYPKLIDFGFAKVEKGKGGGGKRLQRRGEKERVSESLKDATNNLITHTYLYT